MKRWLTVAGFVVVTALAGHFLGRARGAREVLAERNQDEAARTARQRAIGEAIARPVRGSDEIVLTVFGSQPGLKQEKSFRDDAWRSKLAELLVKAPCEPTSRALWVTGTHLEFKTRGNTVLMCTWLDRVLRVHGEGISGDFIVGDAVIAELNAQVKAKHLMLSRTES